MRPHAVLLAALTLFFTAPVGAWQALPEGLFAPIELPPFAVTAVTAVGGDVAAVGGSRFVVLRLAGETGEELWRYDGGAGEARAVAVDGAGDILAVGYRGDLATATTTVIKLAGATGAVVWSREVLGDTAPFTSAVAVRGGQDVAVDASGDVFAAGTVFNASGYDDAVVARLSAATGAELWRYTLDELSDVDAATTVRLDPAGDVIAAAVRFEVVGSTSSVIKLSGATGAEVWRVEYPDLYPSVIYREPAVGPIAVNDAGDVAVQGFTLTTEGGSPAVRDSVFLLAGGNGGELWRHVQRGPYLTSTQHLALLPAGDVVAADAGLSVVRLARADGHEVWRHDIQCDPADTLGALAVDASGDVAVAGLRGGACTGRYGPAFTLVKLAGTDGSERWRRIYGAEQPYIFSPTAMTTTGPGDVVTGGSVVLETGPLFDSIQFAVVSASGTTGALDVCGDGYVDASEECDDGNTADGDCCSATCRAAPNGTPCSDGNHCTEPDTCQQAVCQPGPALPCEPCGRCDPYIGCIADLPFECLAPTATARAFLSLDVRHPALAWDWTSGAATTKSDFGNPRTSTGYALCIYGDQPDGAPLLRATANPGKSCAKGKGCWRKTSKGFHYESGSKSPDGLSAITLQEGGPGKARITVRGKGGKLGLPPLPLTAPVTVQLRKLDGSPPCWTAEHGTVVKNTARHFVARGD